MKQDAPRNLLRDRETQGEPRNLLRSSQPESEAQPAPEQQAPRRDVRMDAMQALSNPLGYVAERGGAVVNNFMQQPVASANPAQAIAEEAPTAQLALQGYTMGAGDEIAGAVAELGNRAGGGSGGVYRENADAFQEGVDQSREDAPVTSFLTEMASGGAMGAGAFRAFAQRFPGATRQIVNFASRHPTIALALGGGGTGAAAGALENNDDRAQGAALGGGLGLVLGPVVRGAVGLHGKVFRRSGSTRLAQTGRRAGVTADDVANMNGDFLAETAENPRARSVAVGLAGEGDDAQAVIRDAVNDRQAGRAGRLSDAVEGATGSRGGASALLQLDEIRDQARPLFNAADDRIGRMTPQLRENLRAANRAGVSFRNADELAARNGDARVQLSSFADDVDGLPDQIRLGDVRAMARAVENEARRLSRAGEDPGQLWNLAREMRDQIGRQSREYRQAAQMWRSAARDEEAFELGQRAFRPGGQQERALRRFFTNGSRSQSEQRNFLAGVADAMDQRLSGAAETGNPAARLNRSLVRQRLRIVLGDDAGDELMSTIMRENRRAGFENMASREVNSATAARAEGREHARSAISGPTRQVMGDLAEDVSGTLMARNRIANAVRGSDPEAAADLARLLVARSQDDPIVQQFLRELDLQYVTPVAPEMARLGGHSAAQLTSQ